MVSLQIHYTIQVASEPVFIDDLWDSSDFKYCSIAPKLNKAATTGTIKRRGSFVLRVFGYC